jgi:hypothetical protein
MKVLKSGRGRQKKSQRRCEMAGMSKGLTSLSLTLSRKKGSQEPEMWIASRKWKGQEYQFFSRPSRGSTVLLTTYF